MTLPMGRALRDVFGQTVTELANNDPRIVMLDADTGSSTKADVSGVSFARMVNDSGTKPAAFNASSPFCAQAIFWNTPIVNRPVSTWIMGV